MSEHQGGMHCPVCRKHVTEEELYCCVCGEKIPWPENPYAKHQDPHGPQH